jgi:hypothetical protein
MNREVEAFADNLYAKVEFNNYGVYNAIFEPLVNYLKELYDLGGRDKQSLSSLHKTYYYSYVDDAEGIKKHIDRRFIGRPTREQDMKKLLQLYSKLFCKNYFKSKQRLPQLVGDVDQINKILTLIEQGDFESYDKLELDEFGDIGLDKNLEFDMPTSFVEFIKDKGAANLNENVSGFLTDKEIKIVLMDSGFKFDSLTLMDFLLYDINDPTCTIYDPKYKFKIVSTEMKLLAILFMKEREQKAEGRPFGS